MRLLIFGLLTIMLTSCGEPDNFREVTKMIDAPDTIMLDKEFDFQLILKNDTDNKIKLTVDKDVIKSVHFQPDWTCDNVPISHRVPNPKSLDNNFQIHYLNKRDSLTYNLKGRLTNYGTDSLEFVIIDYDRVFRLKKPTCNNFVMNLAGMWLPGDVNPTDSMEGYNFGQTVKIRE